MDTKDFFDMNIIQNLKDLSNGDDSFLKEIVDIYLNQAPGLINDIRTNAFTNNSDSLSKSAHTLKGASLNVGAFKFADICNKIEIAGKENNLQNIDNLISEMDSCYNLVKELIVKL